MEKNEFNYFDMNLVHAEDYKIYKLDPKPFTYRTGNNRAIDFEGYLEGY